MEIVIKAAAVGLTAAFAGVILSKKTPEFSLLIGMSAVIVILVPVIKLTASFTDLISDARAIADISPQVLAPIVKCLAIAVVTKTACALCRDAGQSASASTLELTGAVTALCIAAPLLKNMLTMIGSFI